MKRSGHLLIVWLIGILAGMVTPQALSETPPPVELHGDGVADDTAALQNALNTRRIVALGPGSYRITRSVTLSSGTALIGSGKIIVDFDTGEANASNAALHGQGQDIRLEGFSIVKRFRDGSYGTGVLIDPGSQNIVVRNVEISGYSARYGIHIIESENFEITGCYIHDFLMDTSADMIVDSPAGIRTTRCRSGIISNNRILRIEVGAKGYTSVSPLRADYGKQTYQSDCLTVMECRSIALVGNVLETSGEGIDLLLSEECTVSANSIRNIWFQGIKMLGVRHTTVTGNVVKDCLQGIGLAEHVARKSDCVGNTVAANTILDPGAPGAFRVPSETRDGLAGAYGIDLDGRCLGNVVAHNIIRDNQPKKSMILPIRGGEEFPNVIEGNSVAANAK